MTTDTLIALAYTYFPYGIEDSSIEYFQTTEHKKLISKLAYKSNFIEKFKIMGENIINTLPMHGVFEDYSSVLKLDRCVKGKITFTKEGKNKTIGIYISLLLPYFVIIQSIFDGKGMINSNSYLINQQISIDYEIVAKQTKVMLTKFWPEYRLREDNVLNTFVENVMFDGSGYLDIWHSSTNLRPMTIFNIYFTEFLF